MTDNQIVLIDLSSISRPIYEVHTNDADPNSVSTNIVAKVRALASGHRHVAIACDSGRSFRRDISADYKAQRPETPATYLHQIELAQDILRGDGFPVWAAKGFEADDILATASERSQSTLWVATPHDVLVVTGDKDMHQLVNEHVSVFRPAVGKNPAVTYDLAHFKEQHAGLEPAQIVDYLALCGDSSDNIKGADGVGPKTAAKLLTEYGNLDDLAAALDSGKATFTPALQKSLTAFFAVPPDGLSRCALARSLLTLRTDVPIPFDELFRERAPVDADMSAEMETDHAEDVQEADDAESVSVGAQSPARNGGEPQETANCAGQEIPEGPSRAISQAVVVREPEVLAPAPAEWKLQLEPRSMTQAIQLADRMFASRLLNANGYGAPQAVLLTILAGRELGFQATASLRAFHIIDSKPTLAASAIRALVIKSGVAEYFRCTERSDQAATFVTKRKGSPEQTLRFTIDDARRSWSKGDDAWKKSGYGRNPADQLVARASSKLANLEYPDVLLGLYSTEEMEDAE